MPSAARRAKAKAKAKSKVGVVPPASAARTLLDPAVIRELSAEVPGFDRKGLLAAMIQCWGGVEAVGRDIHMEFQFAKPGSMVRQRILELVARLIGAEDEAGAGRTPVEALDDESLRRQLVGLGAMLDGIGGVGVAVNGVPVEVEGG